MSNLTKEIADVQVQLDKLKVKYEEEQRLKEVGTGDWVPETGDSYLFLYSDGLVSETRNIRSFDDQGRIALGNVYPATKATRKHLEQVIKLKKRFRQRVKEVNQGVPRDERVWHLCNFKSFEGTPFVANNRQHFIQLPKWTWINNRDAAKTLVKEFTPQDMKDIYESLR